MSQHEKFRKANILTAELAIVVSEASRSHYYQRLDLIKKLIDSWKNGEEMAWCTIDEGWYSSFLPYFLPYFHLSLFPSLKKKMMCNLGVLQYYAICTANLCPLLMYPYSIDSSCEECASDKPYRSEIQQPSKDSECMYIC